MPGISTKAQTSARWACRLVFERDEAECKHCGVPEKILLVCCGEMGRTPSINKNGGRDHWGNLAPLGYGGGLKMGRVIGQSSRDGGEPASEAVTMKDLLATIMHTLLDITEVRLMPGIPQRVIEAMTKGEPIRGLV